MGEEQSSVNPLFGLKADDSSAVPDDWGLPGWSRERFEAFNDARRRLHKAMQGWDHLLPL